MSKTERLNNALAEMGRGDLYAEYRPGTGWWLCGEEARYIGDDGDWLASNWRDALDAIEFMVIANV